MIELHLLRPEKLSRGKRRTERLIRGLPFGEGERARLLSMEKEAPMRQSLGAWLALQRLTKKIGRKASLETLRAETGKPRFADPALPQFSLSHSDALCVAALCDRADVSVGVDLQVVDARRHTDAIAARFFTPEERARCAESHDEFFRLWTQKEAIAKASGDGLLTLLRTPDAKPSAYLRTWRIRSGEQVFYLSVASDAEIASVRIKGTRRHIQMISEV